MGRINFDLKKDKKKINVNRECEIHQYFWHVTWCIFGGTFDGGEGVNFGDSTLWGDSTRIKFLPAENKLFTWMQRVFFGVVFRVKWRVSVSVSITIGHTFAWCYCIWIWCTCTRLNWGYVICIHHRCVWGVKVRWWIYFWWNELRRLRCHLKSSQNHN